VSAIPDATADRAGTVHSQEVPAIPINFNTVATFVGQLIPFNGAIL
jgi:hypothetical protein